MLERFLRKTWDVETLQAALSPFIDFNKEVLHHDHISDDMFDAFQWLIAHEYPMTKDNFLLWKWTLYNYTDWQYRREHLPEQVKPYCNAPHFLHQAEEDNRVRYIRGNQLIVTTLGRFLNQYVMDNLSDWQARAKITNEFASRFVEFGIALDRHEIRQVYRYGPRSCMKGVKYHWWRETHPSEAYASGDIGVAWARSKKKRTYVARAVLNLKKKTYVRAYGPDYWPQLLQEHGFRYEDNLIGCRLLKLPVPTAHRYRDDDSIIVMPYLDSRGTIAIPDPEEPENYLVIRPTTEVSLHRGTPHWGNGNTAGKAYKRT